MCLALQGRSGRKGRNFWDARARAHTHTHTHTHTRKLGLWVNHRSPWSRVFLTDVESRTGGLSAVPWEPGYRTFWVGQSPNQAESLEPFTPTSWAWAGSSALYLPRPEGHGEAWWGTPSLKPPPQGLLPGAGAQAPVFFPRTDDSPLLGPFHFFFGAKNTGTQDRKSVV